MCVRVCDVEFVIFTDCDSCTRPISTNSVSVEAGEHGLRRGKCFVRASSRGGRVRPAAATFAVRSGWRGLFCFFFRLFFCFLMRTACCKCEVALPHLPLYYLRVRP